MSDLKGKYNYSPLRDVNERNNLHINKNRQEEEKKEDKEVVISTPVEKQASQIES